ncbi:MAG: metal ABC transporter permease [Actinobacteria bacterium]|nr:metal ABC transporter permease [Actinomycetota bacterium]
MTSGQLEIQAIAVVTAAACALVGMFLVLRRTSLLSDAIGHSVLVGIVLAFFVTGTTTSPLLLVAAAATGVVTVALVDLVVRTRLVREDAAIGLVFPTLFSIGVILVSRYADGVHLDTDAVLLGELAFAPFDRLVIGDFDLGPTSLVVMSVVLVVVLLAVALIWKELALTTFDPALALALGFAPTLVNYVLMSLVSVTTVGAFNAVGSILVVALMIAPGATAYLLTDSMKMMAALSVAIGVGCAIGGYWLSYAVDASIAGCMAAMCGAAFAVVWALGPRRGLLTAARRRARQKLEFAETMLAIHLAHHEALPEAAVENRVANLNHHLGWSDQVVAQVVRSAENRGLVVQRDGMLALTETGRALAGEALVR